MRLIQHRVRHLQAPSSVHMFHTHKHANRQWVSDILYYPYILLGDNLLSIQTTAILCDQDISKFVVHKFE